MSNTTDVAELLRRVGNAQTVEERTALYRQAEELKSKQHEAAFASGDWSADNAKINDTLVPAPTHELLRTASIDTDWITQLDTSFDPKQATQQMVAEASIWYNRVDDEVKSYGEEYAEQAKNLARRLAGQYGDAAEVAEQAFLTETSRLRATAVKAGLVKEADAGETPPETKGPAQNQFESAVEDRLDDNNDGQADPQMKATSSLDDDPTTGMIKSAAHAQAGHDLYSFLAATEPQGDPGVYHDSPDLTNSNRAPALQELSSTSQDVVPVNDPGLGQTDDLTGANANSGGERDNASKRSFPVEGTKKETSMTQYVACPRCAGHGKVAAQQREAASGLPQIDQIADSHDNPSTTPYPADVMWPWTLDPQTDVPNAINQAEEQIAQRNSLSPLQQQRSRQNTTPPRKSSFQPTAGGRDNSGWMGDNGARGTDYPGEQVGNYPAPSTSEGYVDPVYGQGGDNGNQPMKPYGAAEADDYTNNPGQNWQPGQPTQDDQGWKEVVAQDPSLQSAAAYIAQRREAYLRAQR